MTLSRKGRWKGTLSSPISTIMQSGRQIQYKNRKSHTSHTILTGKCWSAHWWGCLTNEKTNYRALHCQRSFSPTINHRRYHRDDIPERLVEVVINHKLILRACWNVSLTIWLTAGWIYQDITTYQDQELVNAEVVSRWEKKKPFAYLTWQARRK